MKRLFILILTFIVSGANTSLSGQEQFLKYAIYYGNADSQEIQTMDWSPFDMIILYPGDPETNYKNLKDSQFLLMMQLIRNAGAKVFLYVDVGCEKDAGGEHYSETDRESWMRFKKKEIDILMRYADGILLDCIGPAHGNHTYGPQFGKDVQELVDYVHYSRGEVIISDLWTVMDWVGKGQIDLVPQEADYFLLEGAWSMTPDQYSDDWNPLDAVNFARMNNLKVLGLDFVREEDEERIMYCYCASRVFGFSGFCCTEDFYEITPPEVPELGAALGTSTVEDNIYTREFERGKVFVSFQTHRGWIEGEAEEVGFSGGLVVLGFLVLWLKIKRENKYDEK